MKKEFSFLEKKKKEEEKGACKKIIKSEDKSWTEENQDGYYHPQKEQLKVSSFKVMKSAPTVRTEFNAARRTYLDDVLNGINNPMSEVSSLFHFKGNVGRTSGATFPMKKNFAGVKVVDDCGAVALTNEEVKTIAREIRRRSRSKLIQFWDNRRPPYWGTWGKSSHSVGPRRPFSKEKTLDYNADSDDEWEKKIKEIEVYTISDSEEEGEEPEPASNNSMIDTVPHAEFLTEVEMLRKEYERQKELQMMSLLASFQCVSEEQPNDDPNPKPQGEVLPQPSRVEELSIGKKRRRDESDDPGSARKRKPSKLNPANTHLFALSSKRFVCEESIPALIRFIHGSTCSKLKTVKKFQLYLARIIPEKNVPCQSRVLAKFGEIAALDKCTEEGPLNGKMCYFVHENILEQYNLSDLSPTRHGNLGTGHRNEEEATLSRIEVTTPQSRISRVLVQHKSGLLQESFCRDF